MRSVRNSGVALLHVMELCETMRGGGFSIAYFARVASIVVSCRGGMVLLKGCLLDE